MSETTSLASFATSLQFLELQQCRIRKVGFFRLASWTHLTKLVLERLKWVHDFSSVGDLDGLQVLHIRDCKISVGNQRPCFLARLSQHLHALSLRGSVIDSIEMVELSTALARYDQLERLDLSHVKIVSVSHDLNWPIVSFESLSRLRDVVLIVVHEKYSWGSMPRLTPDCLVLLPMGMLEQLRSLQIQMDLHSPACCLNTLSRCISLRVLKLEVAHSCAKPLDLVVIAALPTNLSKLSITTHDDVENFGRRNPDYSIIPRQKTPRSVVSSARRLELTCGMLTDDVARACSHVEVFKVRKARRPSGSKVRIPVLAEVELVLAMPRLRKLEMDHPVILTGDPHAIGTLFRRLVAFGGDVCETTEVLDLGALPTRECCVQGSTMLSIVQAMWWLEELDLWRIESIEPSDLRLLLRNMSRLRKLVLSRRVSCEELHTHREDFPLLTTLLHPSEDCWWMAEHSAYKKPSTLG